MTKSEKRCITQTKSHEFRNRLSHKNPRTKNSETVTVTQIRNTKANSKASAEVSALVLLTRTGHGPCWSMPEAVLYGFDLLLSCAWFPWVSVHLPRGAACRSGSDPLPISCFWSCRSGSHPSLGQALPPSGVSLRWHDSFCACQYDWELELARWVIDS